MSKHTAAVDILLLKLRVTWSVSLTHCSVVLLGHSTSHREHNSPSIVACIRVYKAVAWQRVDQIRYSILELIIFFSFSTFCIMEMDFSEYAHQAT